MDQVYYYIIGALIIILILIWILIRTIRKRRAKAKLMEQEVLNDFQEAEARLANGHGNVDPQKILWELAKSKDSNNILYPQDNIPTQETSTEYKPKPKVNSSHRGLDINKLLKRR